ncbi:hypothetical protein B0H14DRAFT_2564447 [Mycena olivaceomarginata]|nr:hypothetical protein B0H14DRAFT_2564447 [Mycena olivaceomarginata]
MSALRERLNNDSKKFYPSPDIDPTESMKKRVNTADNVWVRWLEDQMLLTAGYVWNTDIDHIHAPVFYSDSTASASLVSGMGDQVDSPSAHRAVFCVRKTINTKHAFGFSRVGTNAQDPNDEFYEAAAAGQAGSSRMMACATPVILVNRCAARKWLVLLNPKLSASSNFFWRALGVNADPNEIAANAAFPPPCMPISSLDIVWIVFRNAKPINLKWPAFSSMLLPTTLMLPLPANVEHSTSNMPLLRITYHPSRPVCFQIPYITQLFTKFQDIMSEKLS